MPIKPINYALDVKDPFLSVMKGKQLGQQDLLFSQQQAAAAASKAANAQMNQDLFALSQKIHDGKASPDDLIAMTVKYPALAEHSKPMLDQMSAEEKDALGKQAFSVTSAYMNGRTDIAQAILDRNLEAAKASGNEQKLKGAQLMSDMAKADAGSAGLTAFLASFASMGGDNFTKAISGATQFRSDAEKASADVDKTRNEADKIAAETQKTRIENEILGSTKDAVIGGTVADNTKKVQEADNQRQKDYLANEKTAAEIEKLRKEALTVGMTDKMKEAVANAPDSLAKATFAHDAMLGKIDEILDESKKKDLNNATGPVNTRLPTTSEDTAAMEEMIKTLTSQGFLAMLPQMKGMGSLSNAEGDKLSQSFETLDPRQGYDAMVKHLQDARASLQIMRKDAIDNYNAKSSTRAPDSIVNRPARLQAQSLNNKYGAK